MARPISLHGHALLGGLLVAGAATLVFANSLLSGFAVDDVAIVQENPIVTSAGAWWSPWVHPYWPYSNRGDRDDLLYRPLTVQTYGWQWDLHGDVAWPFHLVNVVLHTAISVGVWWLARRLGARAGAALFAGLLFAVHPVHTDAVSNIVGRAELLAAGATLLAVACALGAQSRRYEHREGRWTAALWVCAWMAAAAALASKENGVSALALVAFVGLAPGVRFGRPGQSPTPGGVGRPRWARRVVAAIVPALLIFGVYLAVRYEVGGDRLTVMGQRVAVSNPLRDVEGVARWLTPPALLGRYVWMTIAPQRLLWDYSLNVLPPVSTPADGTLWLGVAFVVGAGVLVVRRSPWRPVWWLLLVGFASSYFLASNSLLLIDVIFAERLWYGPSMWISAALAIGLSGLGPQLLEYQRLARVLGAAALVVFGLRTVVRNPDWRDSRTVVARDLAAMHPDHRSAQLCAFMAQYKAEDGELVEAEGLLREAIAIYPDKALYHRVLGEVYLAMQRPLDAERALREALTIDASRRETLALLEQAQMAAAGRDLRGEYLEARAAALGNSNDVDALRRWARLAESAAPDEAVVVYRRLVELAPDDVDHWSGLALAQYGVGDVEGSAATYGRILERWPDDWHAHTNLALLLMDRTYRTIHDPAAALYHGRRAVELNPEHWNLRVNLAEVTARCGDRREAADMFAELARQSDAGSTQQRLYADRARHLRK